MASYSSEVVTLITFIKSLNQDRISDAKNTLIRFSNRKYIVQLRILIDRFRASHDAQKTIGKLIKDNVQLKQKIRELQMKIIEEKKRKVNKQDYGKWMSIKAALTDCIITDNLQAALKDAKQHKLASLQVAISDIMEYRWIKQTLPNPKLPQQLTQPPIDINFSKSTNHIKQAVSGFKKKIDDINKQMVSQLFNFYNHNPTQPKLSSSIFHSEVQQLLEGIIFYKKKTQKQIQEQLTQFRTIIMEACNRRSLNKEAEQYEIIPLLRFFIKSSESGQPAASKKKDYHEIRTTSSSKQPPLQYDLEELVENINILLSTPKLDLFSFAIKEPSFKALLECFCSIVEHLGFTKQSVQLHKEMLSGIANTESTISSTLMKMNVQLKLRVPQSVSIADVNFSSEMIGKFESNLNQLLNRYDEQQMVIVSLEAKEEKIVEQLQIKQEETGSSQERVEELKPVLNELLGGQIQALKKQLEQAYTVIALEKKNSEKLRQKIKMSTIHSSFFLSPQFTEHKQEAELQEQINALRVQNERLKESLEEQRALNSNFQKRLAQILVKAQATKAAEMERQKQRYENLRQELNESIEQIQRLNKIIQDKQLFSSKRMSINDKKQSIIDQVERKNFMSKIVQASVILNTVEDVDDPVLLQKIEELQTIIKELREMMQTKENEYRQNIKNMQNSYNRDIQDLKSQNASLNNKIKELQMKVIVDTPQNLKNAHIFPPGFIFDYADHEERLYLIENLVSYLGTIKRTRLLFRYDHLNKTNFHRYIDGQRNIVVIIKTIYGKLIAAYSEQAFVQGATNRGFGLLLSLWARRSFRNKDQRAISYDDYYILFGNSQLRLKSQQMKVFSNFGIANGYYDNKGQKVHVILGEDKQRQVEIAEYEIYALDLQD